MPLQITSPRPNALFTITDEPAWPAIQFQTNASLTPGQRLTWNWKIHWDNFSRQGRVQTETSSWNAQSGLFQSLTAGVITNLGGSLSVHVTGPGGAASITVRINGTNPSRAAILAFLACQPNSTGFDRILQQESTMIHFNAQGDPIKSFDRGFGIAQLTNPAPTYEQVWNWKLNIARALGLFQDKRNDAIAHLSQQGRSYTPDQLTRETVSRWNGSPYYVWDGHGWVRPANILCDSHTGNIGWNMSDPANAGHTEAQLRARDLPTYAHPKEPGHHWRFSGVCFADHVLR